MDTVKVNRIHHTAITVSDYDRSIKFYRDILGMEIVLEAEFDRNPQSQPIHDLKDERFQLAFLAVPSDLGGGMIELFHFIKPKCRESQDKYQVCDHGWTHVCFVTEDIEKTYQEPSSKGVKFTTPPIQVQPEGIKIYRVPQTASAPMMGQVKATYFYDPDGLILELIQLH